LRRRSDSRVACKALRLLNLSSRGPPYMCGVGRSSSSGNLKGALHCTQVARALRRCVRIWCAGPPPTSRGSPGSSDGWLPMRAVAAIAPSRSPLGHGEQTFPSGRVSDVRHPSRDIRSTTSELRLGR
jgi:hypothetical protein